MCLQLIVLILLLVLLELLNEEEDKNNVLEVENLMLVALEEKTLEEDKL